MKDMFLFLLFAPLLIVIWGGTALFVRMVFNKLRNKK